MPSSLTYTIVMSLNKFACWSVLISSWRTEKCSTPPWHVILSILSWQTCYSTKISSFFSSDLTIITFPLFIACKRLESRITNENTLYKFKSSEIKAPPNGRGLLGPDQDLVLQIERLRVSMRDLPDITSKLGPKWSNKPHVPAASPGPVLVYGPAPRTEKLQVGICVGPVCYYW